MAILRVTPQTGPLWGTISVPGDKSLSHRSVLFGALAEGESVVRGWLAAGDTRATLEAMRALGVEIAVDRQEGATWDLRIQGRGLHGLRSPAASLDCQNAGTCLRLLAGILAGQDFPSTLDGSAQLRRRPMRRIVEPLAQMGARIEAEDGTAPLSITPAELEGITYRMPVASAQVKSAVLLAGLCARGETRVYQPGPARDHTERLLAAMGVPLTVDGNWITLPAAPSEGWSLQPLDLTIPGDISSAAFPLVAAMLVPHSRVTVTGVGLNQTRTGLLALLAEMGATYVVTNRRTTAGEPAGDIGVTFEELQSSTARGEVVVRAIDEFPIWAIAATQAAGRSRLEDAAELRVKEVDRIAVLAGELRKMGVAIEEHAGGFTVSGPVRPAGGDVSSHGDHRLGMALAVAGLVARTPTRIHEAEVVADSFPGFVEAMQALGARMEWVE